MKHVAKVLVLLALLLTGFSLYWYLGFQEDLAPAREAASLPNTSRPSVPSALGAPSPTPAPARNPEEVQVAIDPEEPQGEGVVQVVVRDREGTAVAAVPVVLEIERLEGRAWEKQAGKTNEIGMVIFEGLGFAKYMVSARKGALAGRAGGKLRPERPVARRVVVMKPEGSVVGSVLDANGIAVPGATVELVSALREQTWPVKTQPDSEGHFAFEGVPIGRYKVQAFAPGHAPAVSEEVPVDAAPLQLRLASGGTLVAIIRHAVSNQPVSNFTVKLSFAVVEGFEVRATSDVQGRLALDHLPVGDCKVVADDPKFALYPSTATVGIATGRTTQTELLVEDGAVVTGKVIDADLGKPIAGVIVTAQDDPATVGWESKPTGAAGEYRLEGVAPGQLSLMLRQLPATFGFGVIRMDMQQKVSISPGELREDVDFSVSTGPTVTGKVVDEAGQPIPSAMVYMEITREESPESKSTEQSITDGLGHFYFTDVGIRRSIRYEDGEEVPEEVFENIQVAVQAKTDLGRSTKHGPVSFPEQGLQDILLALDEKLTGSISGTVVDGSGKPLALHVRVRRTDETNRLDTSMIFSDVDGFFRADDLAAGTYEILLSPTFASRKMVGHELQLAQGQDVKNLRVVFQVGGTITGRVLDSEGNPMPRFGIDAESVTDRDDALGTETDLDGNFELINLGEGQYVLYGTNDGAHRWSRLAIAGDEVEIVLPAEGQQGVVEYQLLEVLPPQ